jgi:hypothetical protein
VVERNRHNTWMTGKSNLVHDASCDFFSKNQRQGYACRVCINREEVLQKLIKEKNKTKPSRRRQQQDHHHHMKVQHQRTSKATTVERHLARRSEQAN